MSHADIPSALGEVRSALPGIAWPAVPAQRAASLLSLLYQLDRTQWWSPERLLEAQLRQAGELLRHAHDHVPFHRRRFGTLDYRPAGAPSLEEWRGLPLLTRREIQDAGSDLMSAAVPVAHGKIFELQTSGSTGEPVKVRCSGVDQLVWEALTLREHLWHRRDFSGKLAVIRATTAAAAAPPHGLVQDDWGPPVNIVFPTGPSAMLSLEADIGLQVEWLKHHQPQYLLTYPNNLAALIERFSAERARPPRLRSVRTIGETVTEALRAACRNAWGVEIVDSYSSQELGSIAAQCPESGLYHVMAEGVLVELVGADGRPCRPGEIGRLVITKLHGFATPLIRYDLRDYAEAGPPCPCGRGLPTLARILGRSRHLVTLPGGGRHWPQVGFAQYREIAPVRQYQLVQHELNDIEVRLVVERSLAPGEERRLARRIQAALGHPFNLRFTYFPGEIPRGPGGKFEEFVSKIES